MNQVYHDIRRLIVHGRLPPGARIAEGSLAEFLGVSRTPVREALQRLRQERLLVSVGGGAGVRSRLAVAPLSREAMYELYSLAAALEGLATRSLAKLSGQERDSLSRELEKVEERFYTEAAKPAPDYDALFELHDAFHRKLIHASRASETKALLDAIRPQLDRYEWFYAPLVGPDFSATRAEHAAIVRAIRSGTAQEIEQAVRTNWLNAAVRLGPVIEQSSSSMHNSIPRYSLSFRNTEHK